VQFEGETVVAGGDVVLALDGIDVRTSDDLVRIVTNQLKPNQTAVFTVLRGGRRRDIAVRLIARPLNPSHP
jgi:S1-C subfamily serine protease